MQYVYHSSNIEGLLEIKPQKSTHGIELVYASKHMIISSLFLARWNDFLLTLQTELSNDELKIALVERYPNAFEEIFKEKSGYIYCLDKSMFTQSTTWECEVVSTNSEKVLDQIIVKDTYKLIKEYEKQGKIELFYYPNRPSSIPPDDSDMPMKAIELYRSSGNLHNIDYCIERFPQFEKQLLKEKEKFNFR